MFLVVILLALAYGSPDMSFPWWIWVLALIFGSLDIDIHVPYIGTRARRDGDGA